MSYNFWGDRSFFKRNEPMITKRQLHNDQLAFLYFSLLGDMRTFKAVDVRALYHLVDCVVFPAKGQRPHTDEMSGSDLDGDKYFVTWYDKLLPPREENVEPMDFTSPAKKILFRPVEVSDMVQFVADYIKNDQLGIIANAHLVHADANEEGTLSYNNF